MAKTETEINEERLHVLEGVELEGNINTPDAKLAENVRHSIRLGYPQLRPQSVQRERVCLVGGGPSLESTEKELIELYFGGAKVVTVNGSYKWCVERNIRPAAHIMLDAQPENAKFVDPPVPQCRYLIASQCDPKTWEAVKGRDVWIWHAAAGDNEILKPILDDYYLGNWMPTPGGTTVIMRAISILRATGFLRFDLFGVDSCLSYEESGRYIDSNTLKHHAYPQPENDLDTKDARVVLVSPTGHPELSREFLCAPWHIKQLEDLLQIIRLNGDSFLLHVHGDGLLAFALQSSASVAIVANPLQGAT